MHPHLFFDHFTYASDKHPKSALFKEFNHPPTHLVCNDHLMATFLSFHMSLVVVMNCGAGNALHGFEINMFYFFYKTLFYTHIQRCIATAGTKCYKAYTLHFQKAIMSRITKI